MARDLVKQYEMQTGESIELFLDRDALEWGDDWKPKVDGSLANVAFFIPVVTPRYFQSAECRRELRFFATQAERLGLKELVMPLLYVDFPGLHEGDPADDLIATVKRFQWEDWTDGRFAERESGQYRKRVVELATRLASANAAAADITTAVIEAAEAASEDDEPGLLDRIAESEEALPAWSGTVDKVGEIIEGLGDQMAHAQAEMEAAEKRGKGFAGRLTVARKLAQIIDEPGDQVVKLGSDFVEQLNAVDSGIRAIIELAPQTVERRAG